MNESVKTTSKKQTRIGTVLKKSSDKTISVEVISSVKHPLVKKFIRRKAKFLVHDEKNEAPVGSKVEIIETRPLSKVKRWKLVRIID